MFQTPIATGQHVGRKNLIFRNGDDTHIHNQDEVLYIMATILRRLTGKISAVQFEMKGVEV